MHAMKTPQSMKDLLHWRPASWGGLRILGDDALAFLQGQLSHDLSHTPEDGYCWSSYSSPKGRVLAVLRMRAVDTGFEALMPSALVEPIARRLRMFVLRSKVQFEVLPPESDDAEVALQDRKQLIDAGLPVVYPETQDRWVAQMLNLDQLSGISFDKGCYTGQEVIARLHYLGKLKQRLFRVNGSGPVPAPGAAIVQAEADTQAIGEIVDALQTERGFEATAVLRQQFAESDALRLRDAADARLQRPQACAYD